MYASFFSLGSCGVSTYSQSRVIAGENSHAGQWPWQAGLLSKGRFFCGGSLIAPEWVLTAAHCVHYYDASTTKVVLGKQESYSHKFNKHYLYII